MGLAQNNFCFERAAAGYEQGITPVLIQGENGAVTTSLETLRPASDAYAFLYADTALKVASGSATDAAGQAGALTVRVTGVNAAGTVLTADVILTGQTEVALAAGKEMMVVTGLEVLTYGAGGTNAGIIYIGTGTFTAGVPAVVHGTIPVGYSKSQDAVYMVPLGQTLFIKDIFFSAASATAGSQRWIIETQQSNTQVSPKVAFTGGSSNATADSRTLSIPLKFPALTKLQVKALSSAGTGPAYVTLSGYLVRDGVQTFVTL